MKTVPGSPLDGETVKEADSDNALPVCVGGSPCPQPDIKTESKMYISEMIKLRFEKTFIGCSGVRSVLP